MSTDKSTAPRADPEDARTVRGAFQIKDGFLVAETNSRQRAARLRVKLKNLLGNLIAYDGTSCKDLDDLPKLTPEEEEARRRESEELNSRPEIRELLLNSYEDHYFISFPAFFLQRHRKALVTGTCTASTCLTYQEICYIVYTSDNWRTAVADQLIIRIDPDLKKSLERLSRAEGKTTSRMVRELIRDYVKERDITAYIDGLWERIGNKLAARGVRASSVGEAVTKARKASR